MPQDFAKAAEWYRKAADQGIVEAEYNLGVLYSNGQGVPKDQTEATHWFLKAVQQGDNNAANSLGDIYDNEGPGSSQNFAEAEKWYRKAAESGVANAQFNLGVMYDIGQGVKQDFAEALKWYRKAADQGNAAALCNIAILYYNGQGVPVDRVQAHRYFLLAKELDEPRAANLIKLTTEKLDSKQIAQAEAEAGDWRRDHPVTPSEGPKPLQPAVVASAGNAPSRPGAALAPVQTVAVRTSAAPAVGGPPTDDTIRSRAWNGLPAEPPAPDKESVWTGVDKVVAVGDVHGDFDQFVRVLKSAGLIDDARNWVGGKAHLVQTGDILDRGGRSREVMDLLIKLEPEAHAAGGDVHCLLGNHEVMNLYGDLRYVSPGDYSSFRDADSAKTREREFEAFRKAAGSAANISEEAWDEQHPLGFFEQRAAFGAEGFYGKWMRSLNTVIRIDDTLFVHSGISRKYASMSVEEINRRVREELSDPTKLQGGIVMDPEGPFFYSGLAKGDEKALAGVLDTTLENDGAKREAFGHNETGGVILTRFNGKAILLDVGLSREYNNTGSMGCLLIEQGKVSALHRGHKLALPRDENGPDMLRYLREAAAVDPQPSPLAGRIEKLTRALAPAAP